MVILNLNFQIAEQVNSKEFLLLFKPVRSKLFRCFGVPDYLKKDDAHYKEIVQVLNTVCTKRINDVWFFKMDEDDKMIFLETFFEMGIYPVLAEPDLEYYN